MIVNQSIFRSVIFFSIMFPVYRFFVILLAGFLLALMLTLSADRGGVRAAGPNAVADLADDLLDAVVNISISQAIEKQNNSDFMTPKFPEDSPFKDLFKDLFPNGKNGSNRRIPKKNQSRGSGFVLNSDGIIITNNHVVADADKIIVNFNDGSKLTAKIIGKDSKTDIAVLRVKSDKPLKTVKFGNSDLVRIGDWVMAIGNPFGFGGSVTLGIISAINRDISSGPYDSFIQTDAAINRGNSGGPLFNMDGDVIGINTAIISPTGGSVGLGFSIPANMANRIINQLIEFGEIRRGWLGVSIQPVTDEMAKTLNMKDARGAVIEDVTEGGPAEKAKLKPGDVILKFDAKLIHTLRDLRRVVADSPIGKPLKIFLLRKGRKMEFEVVLGRLKDEKKQIFENKKPNDGQLQTASALGMHFQEVTEDIRINQKISKDIKGVLITQIEPGVNAEEKGLRIGDLIVEVGQEEVHTPVDILTRLNALKERGRTNALLLVSTNTGDLRFVVVRIEN